MHGAITNEKKKVPVIGRNGMVYMIPDKLDEGDVLWERLTKVIESYRAVDDREHSLFLQGFNKALENQEEIVKKSLFDPMVNGRWYEELEDGRFVLYRGSNRNESIHKR